jgi:acyl carrier protein
MDKRDRVIQLVSQVAKKPVNIGDDESLFDAGLLDSFGLADLVSSLEKEFSLKVPDADLNPRKFDSVERIVEYLNSL